MKKFFLVAVTSCFLSGCLGREVPKRPQPSIVQVTADLDKLTKSLNEARTAVHGARLSMKEADDKAVRIQEAIRKW